MRDDYIGGSRKKTQLTSQQIEPKNWTEINGAAAGHKFNDSI